MDNCPKEIQLSPVHEKEYKKCWNHLKNSTEICSSSLYLYVNLKKKLNLLQIFMN